MCQRIEPPFANHSDAAEYCKRLVDSLRRSTSFGGHTSIGLTPTCVLGKRTIMGMSFARLAASGIVFVFGFACASSESSESGTGGVVQDIPGYAKAEPLTMEQYCEARVALHEPWISYYAKCCVETEERLYSSATVNDADYASTQACMAHLAAIKEAYPAVTYVGAYANAMLQEVSRVIPAAPETCSGTHFGEQLTAALSERGKRRDGLRALLQGSVGEDGTCTASIECKFGLSCQGFSGSYTCKPRTAAGACTFSETCVDGTDCVAGRCQAPASEGSSCGSRSDCPFDLVCTAGRCNSGGGANALCSSGDDCKVGYGCLVANSACVSLKVTGEACTIDGECAGRCSKGRCVGRCGGTGSF